MSWTPDNVFGWVLTIILLCWMWGLLDPWLERDR